MKVKFRQTFIQLILLVGISSTLLSACNQKSSVLGALTNSSSNGSSSVPVTDSSCTFNGVTLASGGTTTGYPALSVPAGSLCMSQTITCNNGVLSPANDFANCTVSTNPSPTPTPAPCSFYGQTVASGSSVTGYTTSSVPYGSTCTSENVGCTNGVLNPSNAFASCTVSPPAATPTPLPTATPPPNANLVFNYTTLASGKNDLALVGHAILDGNNVDLLDPSIVHETGAVWYKTPLNIKSFTTDFTFQQKMSTGAVTGMFFVIQNSNATSNPPGCCGSYYGLNAVADANGLGFGDYPLPPENQQAALGYSVGLKFDLTYLWGINGDDSVPMSSTTGIYADGGPYNGTFGPTTDLSPFGVDLHADHVMSAHVVYDGTTLFLVLTDTVTNAQARLSWPINIPAAVNGNTAYVGFVAGGVYQSAQDTVLSWDYATGTSKLAAPNFSVSSGSYTTAQSVSLTASAGSKIYYTTNGKSPTTASSLYTGPIAVSSSQIIQAIAVESGFSDSAVALASYQINAPVINFAGGMTNASQFMSLTGSAQMSGSNLSLSTSSQHDQPGGAWFLTPVNVQSFTTTYTAQFSNQQSGNDDGMTFTIQNPYDVTSQSVNSSKPYYAYRGGDSGGPYTMGRPGNSFGYFGTNTAGYVDGMMSSVAVVFDSSASTLGVFTNGQNSSGSQLATGLSFLSGHALTTTLTYSGTNLTVTITDTVSKASFTHTWSNINIPAQVGANNAYVGFTSGTGAGLTQLISNWKYSN